MVFWIAILGAALFIWLALRMGFYETWVVLFNVLVSIYVSIFLAPLVARLAPAPSGAGSYMTAMSLVILAGACFALMHGLSYVFLTGQFSVTFPRVFDILLSGAMGFVIGFLILSFIALVVTTTPLAQNDIVSTVGFDPQSMHLNIGCIAWWCDRVHWFAGFQSDGRATAAAVDRLLEKPAETGPATATTPPDPNKPDETSYPKALPDRSSLKRRTIQMTDDSDAP